MNKYSVIESRANAGNFHVRVSEPIMHPKLPFPVGEKVGFSIVMTEDQAKLAVEAANNGEIAFNLVGDANDAGFYNVEVEIPEFESATPTKTLVTES